MNEVSIVITMNIVSEGQSFELGSASIHNTVDLSSSLPVLARYCGQAK